MTYRKPKWGAIAAGALCATGAGAILLEDLRHTREPTVEHLLSIIVLVGTIAAGHMAMTELRRFRLLGAAALALLFALGSTWCVAMTAGRSADHREQLVAKAQAQNRGLDAMLAERQAAVERLQLAEGEVLRECRSGFGGKCKGWQRAVAERQARIRELDAELAKAKPAVPVNATGRGLAGMLILLGVTTPREQLERVLDIVLPFMPALFFELGSIVFFSRGLPHGTRPPAPANDTAPPPPAAREEPAREPEQAAAVRDFVTAYRARHGRDPAPREVRAAFPALARATAWRYQRAA